MVETVAEMVTGTPAPAVRHLVDNYVGYRYEGFEPGTHQGLPSRHLTFIVSLSDPIDVTTMIRPGDAPVSMVSMASGLAAAPVTITHDGNQFGVQLELSPFGARTLFGMPASELAEIIVDLHDLMGPLAPELNERLRQASTWPERFAVLDSVLIRARTETRAPAPELGQAWRRITETGGSVSIGELAGEVGWSRRHLAHTFRSEFGLAPKTVARIVRFERAKNLIRATFPTGAASLRSARPASRPAFGLADIAALCGYFDQAHLTRDFRDLAGCAPTVWLAEELPSVQDTDIEHIG